MKNLRNGAELQHKSIIIQSKKQAERWGAFYLLFTVIV